MTVLEKETCFSFVWRRIEENELKKECGVGEIFL
jgi:hypothetical protein